MDPAMLAAIMQMMNGGNSSPLFAGGSQFLSGLFGNSGAPYKDYGKEYKKYEGQAEEFQNPFYNAGKEALPNYQNWLTGMQDPSGFINNLMGKYQESPWAKFEMQQGQNAANNAASASGLVGSTPFMQASQDYAKNISSQDMQTWLQNVLGINSMYGAGEEGLVGRGQNAANALSGLRQTLGENMGAAAYGERAGENQDTGNMVGGALKFLFG